ncbi:MAG: pyridoxal-phosphate dependent enzyme, partial [Candidatus Neomarinimicrobiota bacterium]
ELASLDWVRKPLPRMVAVQTEGCAPVVRAFEAGRETVEPWPDPATKALGLNVPAPTAGAWMLRVLRASRGRAVAVAEGSLGQAQEELREISGVAAGPESAAAWQGLKELIAEGWIGPEERAVVVITGDDRRYR